MKTKALITIANLGPRPSPKHSVDRIDNNRHYEQGNCRWATVAEQRNNTSQNVLIEFGGKTLTIAQWAADIGVRTNTLQYRLYRGWTVSRALSPKVQKKTCRRMTPTKLSPASV